MKNFETLLMNRLFDELDKDWKCEVCLLKKDSIKSVNPNRAITKLPCNHRFCHECIDQWLSSYKTCTYCSELVYEIIIID